MNDIKPNVLISIIKKSVIDVPGVDKKGQINVALDDNNNANIDFTPFSYVNNIYEISNRIKTTVGRILQDEYKIYIILNVRSIL
ncbi:MAG: hypothetical protein LBV53_00565 [Mycoplasmataceae bacterium]|jgi:hypothetical protein|nr:hypothetical protein [Mycoplasmataceae bacterium]